MEKFNNLPVEQLFIVEPSKASLLATLSSYAIPSTTYPRQLVSLRYGEEDFSPYVISLTFEGTSAHITCEVPLNYADQHNRSAPFSTYGASRCEAVLT